MRAAIVLAAGASRRFGSADKLLARFRGRPLIHHALSHAARAPVARILVVIGARGGNVAAVVHAFPDHRVRLVRLKAGRGAKDYSLLAGFSRLRRAEREALVYLADMPCLPPAIARRLLLAKKPGISVIRPSFRGGPGHPVLIDDTAYAYRRLAAGKAPFDKSAVKHCPAERGTVLDIDTPADLALLGRRHD